MRRLLILAIIFFTLLVFFFVAKGLQFYQSIYKKPTITKKVETNKTVYNFLLLGYGGGTHEGTYLTDSMMLAQLDLKKKKVFIISLPRDLWIKIPTKSGDDFHMKINALYQFDLDQSIRDNYPDIDWAMIKKLNMPNLISLAVTQTTGLTVDNYVAVDFSSFKKIIDTLGGIDINVLKAFEDNQYPVEGKENDLCDKEEIFKLAEPFISPPYDETAKTKLFSEKPEVEKFIKELAESPEIALPCRYEKIEFKVGLTHMDGETALKYVRSRHGIQDGGDFGRAGRQQQFILAVKEKVISVGFMTRIIPLMENLKGDVKTDVSPALIKKLLGQLTDVKEYKLTSLVLSDQNFLTDTISKGGQYVLISKEGMDKWQTVKIGLKNFLAEITPTLTPNPSVKPNN